MSPLADSSPHTSQRLFIIIPRTFTSKGESIGSLRSMAWLSLALWPHQSGPDKKCLSFWGRGLILISLIPWAFKKDWEPPTLCDFMGVVKYKLLYLGQGRVFPIIHWGQHSLRAWCVQPSGGDKARDSFPVTRELKGRYRYRERPTTGEDIGSLSYFSAGPASATQGRGCCWTLWSFLLCKAGLNSVDTAWGVIRVSSSIGGFIYPLASSPFHSGEWKHHKRAKS